MGWVSRVLQPRSISCEGTAGVPRCQEHHGEPRFPCKGTPQGMHPQLWGPALQGRASELPCPLTRTVVNVVLCFLRVVPPLPIFRSRSPASLVPHAPQSCAAPAVLRMELRWPRECGCSSPGRDVAEQTEVACQSSLDRPQALGCMTQSIIQAPKARRLGLAKVPQGAQDICARPGDAMASRL